MRNWIFPKLRLRRVRTGQGGLKKAGSFTIRTQELGGEADATVVLTLVIKYGENMEQEMQIPYTIQIRNYEKQQQPYITTTN